ncbi:mannose-6-phosphate isomerase [Clostridium pascui]|uniref:type I phosphomannose isomerase catalytic subunit n=1 Tax=Clostridium pascui TaxID=46609 RepID=UPI0019595279|nr:type I phosphomannose isomerase catalytic subunit [Clostridium pascui]MBM7869809.1 mannose-6-phosphate isomerase [Clostridium pascui]
MYYPFKFREVYKNYIWGGRNLEFLGKVLPEGKVSESWEASCHEDGLSIIGNGEFSGKTLYEVIKEKGAEILGEDIYITYKDKFPILIKFIDANDKLSVQVHPDDEYAKKYENNSLGKNEMWYIIAAKPESKLICGLRDSVDKERFKKACDEERVEECLNYIEVTKGDIINIPSGTVHAIGEGLLIAEIQQSSNITYRIYDYNRKDANGNERELHLNKALEVINFSEKSNQSGNKQICKEKYKGMKLTENASISVINSLEDEGNKELIENENTAITYIALNKCFCVKLYETSCGFKESTKGEKFHIYTFLEGEGTIIYSESYNKISSQDEKTLSPENKEGMTSNKAEERFTKGQTIFIPASLGEYELKGRFKALNIYLENEQKLKMQLDYLRKSGYNLDEIIK